MCVLSLLLKKKHVYNRPPQLQGADWGGGAGFHGNDIHGLQL